MNKPVRMSFIVIATMLVLLALPLGVAAKKKSSKRKHKTTPGTPVVVTAPVLAPVDADDSFVNNAAPAANATATVTTARPVAGRGLGIESAGDSGSNGKRTKARLTTGPLIPAAATAGSLIISEFRVRGPNGANDEFVEIYNNSGADHTVAALSGSGYAIAASDGVVRCTIPNATVIPAGGHFLCVNSVAYSLATYPSGNGTTATGDATYTTDIADNAGIALFNNNTGGGSFSLANRFDAVGSTSEANTTYKEGAGYPALTPFSIDYSFVRDECGKGGVVNLLGPCTISTPKDTDDNAADFYFVDTNGTSAGAGQRLGAPGPQNLSSPIQRNSTIPALLLDATVASSSPPNRVRDFTSVPALNSTFGTISIRRRFVNNTGANITRLRFRVIDLDTFPAATGFADLRPRTSSAVVVAGINDSATCAATGTPATAPCTVTVEGADLEGGEVGESPNQPNGGGFNSSMSAGTVTLGTPLANGASINLQFLLGIQQTGNFRFYVNIEALP
jgi:Lamin Tail Domain